MNWCGMLIFVAPRSAQRQKWQRHQQLQDQKRNRNFQPGKLSDAGNAEEKEDIFENLIFAEFVSEN